MRRDVTPLPQEILMASESRFALMKGMSIMNIISKYKEHADGAAPGLIINCTTRISVTKRGKA